MGQYKTVTGQNIYDVATHIYGSLDGLTDLLVSNPRLSFAQTLETGTILNYTDDFLVNKGITSALSASNITPSNGSANVYYEPEPSVRIADLYCSSSQLTGAITVSGNGVLFVDWGDNSPYQKITLTASTKSHSHIFNNKINTDRRVRLFGDVRLIDLDVSRVAPKIVHFLKKVAVERYTHGASVSPIEHIRLCDQVYKVSLAGSKISDLLPLISCTNLMDLDLRGDKIKTEHIETYLIKLVANYGARRGCTIRIDADIQGTYQQPSKDANQKYIIKNAMEAVWVLTNEPSWQEGGFWHIIINNTDYTTEV